MRDAFGGVFMMRLMLVFIVIYVAFTAISFKYAKSFRVKNKIIDYVEQNQIIDLDTYFNSGNQGKLKDLDAILAAANYTVTCDDIGYKNGNIVDKEIGSNVGYCYNGIVIKKDQTRSTDKTIYYNINTYANWELGIINKILALGGQDPNSKSQIGGKWTISGEAIVKK